MRHNTSSYFSNSGIVRHDVTEGRLGFEGLIQLAESQPYLLQQMLDNDMLSKHELFDAALAGRHSENLPQLIPSFIRIYNSNPWLPAKEGALNALAPYLEHNSEIRKIFTQLIEKEPDSELRRTAEDLRYYWTNS